MCYLSPSLSLISILLLLYLCYLFHVGAWNEPDSEQRRSTTTTTPFHAFEKIQDGRVVGHEGGGSSLWLIKGKLLAPVVDVIKPFLQAL